MAHLETTTPFAVAHYRKEGYARLELDVLAVRASFEFGKDEAPLKLAAQQLPIRWGERYEGPADQIQRCVVAEDGDTEIGKPTTDIHVSGHVLAPGGEARRDWLSAVSVGPVRKLLRVTGPRQFERSLIGWRLGAAAPVECVRLDYRQAFGGIYFSNELDEHGQREYCAFAGNPAGVGWLPTDKELKPLPKTARREIEQQIKRLDRLTAPQFEHIERPVQSPFDRHAAEGFGPIARWWSPRKERQGTLDEIWRKTRYPEWPADFDTHYYNSAHPELMSAQWLNGDEPLALANCVIDGASMRDGTHLLRTQLPNVGVVAQADFGDGQIYMLEFVLDTVDIDLDRRSVSLTWHCLCTPDQTLQRAVIHGGPLDVWQEYFRKQRGKGRQP